jgi:flavodoxin
MNSIVVFYSLTGKTKLVAESIAKTLGVEVFEIQELVERKLSSFYLPQVYKSQFFNENCNR